MHINASIITIQTIKKWAILFKAHLILTYFYFSIYKQLIRHLYFYTVVLLLLKLDVPQILLTLINHLKHDIALIPVACVI